MSILKRFALIFIPIALGSATSLITAIQMNQLDVVQNLIDEGEDVNQVHRSSGTPLLLAANLGHVDVAALLISNGANVNHAGMRGNTPLMGAAIGGHVDVARLLISNGAKVHHVDVQGRTPLIHAAIGGHVDVARLLITSGAKVDVGDNTRMTPLHHAASRGYIEFVRIMIESGAYLESTEVFRETPLSLASTRGHLDIVRLLIQNGAIVNHAGNYGITPLYKAAARGHLDVAALLIENGANVDDAETKGGYTPMIEAAINRHPDMVRLLIEHGAGVDRTDVGGRTALFWVARKGFVDVARVLILNDANVNHADINGITVLQFAARWVQSRDLMVRSLILAGANPDAIDRGQENGAGQNIYEAVVEPVIGPMELIRMTAVAKQGNLTPVEAFNQISQTLEAEYGISRTQGFLSFAFESRIAGANVFGDRDLHPSWGATVRTIIGQLAALGCTSLNFLYYIAPFIEQATEEDIVRLARILEFLTDPQGEMRFILSTSQDIAISGPALNQVIHRESPGGHVAVVKALYRLYLTLVEISRLEVSIPGDSIKEVVNFLPAFPNLKA